MGKTPLMTENERSARRIVGSNWGLSITVVIAIVGGIVLNLKMFSDMGERNARMEATLSGLAENVSEIKKNMASITTTMHTELFQLRAENSAIRERVAKLETEIKILSK